MITNLSRRAPTASALIAARGRSSPLANDVLGCVIGVMTLTPYYYR